MKGFPNWDAIYCRLRRFYGVTEEEFRRLSARKANFMLAQADALEAIESLKLAGALQTVNPYVKKHERRRLAKELRVRMRGFDPFIPTEAALQKKHDSAWGRMRSAFGFGRKDD